MSSIQEKATHDLKLIMKTINSHELVDDIYAAFKKGPEPNSGFMFTSRDWWSEKEYKAVNVVSNLVLDYDWDSSGYGYMMRLIECELTQKNPE